MVDLDLFATIKGICSHPGTKNLERLRAELQIG